MVTLTMFYLLTVGVACIMATPIHWDTLSEEHGFHATDSYSMDDRNIRDGMTEEDSPSENHELTKYLQDYGYLPQTLPGQRGPETAEANITDAILKFQEFFELPSTGIVDARVQELTLLPRCGIPDVLSFSVGWFRWYDLNLTYRFVELHDSMPLSRQIIGDVVRNAMQLWMDVTSLILCEVADQDTDADIHIRHVVGEHGDGISFDGPGGILAHAFLPTHGEIHFDADENWTMGIADGIDYLQVVVHEIGHALGLLHSGVEGSIMYPFYQFRPQVELHQDDIQGIQLMYGTPTDLPEEVRDQRCPYIEMGSSITEIISTPNHIEEERPSTTMVSELETSDLGVTTSSSKPTVSLTSATTMVITNLETTLPTTSTSSCTTSPVIKSLIAVITVSERTSASLESSPPPSPPRPSSSSSLLSSSSSSSSTETTSSTPPPPPSSPSSPLPSSWSPPLNSLTPTVAGRGETETSSAKESTTFTETGTMVGITQSATVAANTLRQNINTDFTDVIQTVPSTTTESIPVAPVVLDNHRLGFSGNRNSGNSMHNAQMWSLLVLIFYLV